tara:strand:+ start:1368 stop:2801 length:1434 start_codon:yes stop_codon:yes gene_type:complete
MANPKVFFSYSWSSEEHTEWVLRLATELRASGADVILDKWDLKEGYDSNAFMESMVADPTVTKVVMICDEQYASKANSRQGGVGTEAQIISPEVFAKVKQDKFVAVVRSHAANGQPHLPVFYGSRIHIDMSDDDLYSSNFEQLLRWIFDKPFHVKPTIGPPPDFLSQEAAPSAAGNVVIFRQCVDAIKAGKSNGLPLLDGYLASILLELEQHRLKSGHDAAEFDDRVIDSLDVLRKLKDQVVELFFLVSRYSDTPDARQIIIQFFEKLGVLQNIPDSETQYREWDADNLRFIASELFLNLCAVLAKSQKFDFLAEVLNTQYFYKGRHGHIRDLHSFSIFFSNLSSLEHRNKRLGLRRISLRADLLRDRASGSGLEFEDLMQADFLLYLRASVDRHGGSASSRWIPQTLIFTSYSPGAFEIFVRGKSSKYFRKLLPVLGVASKADLLVVMEAMHVPQFEYDRIDVAMLSNIEKLATTP